mmetsp:Transcript_46152/g.90968  ORF Transcript_46152/g.90968 Transcript_46152/m.90968 type:complete len:80 (-) Transcript_46152:1455-1694(-)
MAMQKQCTHPSIVDEPIIQTPGRLALPKKNQSSDTVTEERGKKEESREGRGPAELHRTREGEEEFISDDDIPTLSGWKE